MHITTANSARANRVASISLKYTLLLYIWIQFYQRPTTLLAVIWQWYVLFGHSVTFHLPAFYALTIPNYPNYYLGALTGSLCDSLTAISTQASLSNEINLFPIPSHDLCYLMGIHHGISVIITDANFEIK